MRRRLSSTELDQIFERLRAGDSQSAIARAFACNPESIRYHMKKAGILRTPQTLRPCAIDGCGRVAGVPGTARGLCCAHYSRLKKYGDPLGGGPTRNQPWEPICRVCGETKDESEFPIRRESGKRRTDCAACQSRSSMAWAAANRLRRNATNRRWSDNPARRERTAENALMRTHGITREQAQELRHNRACGICERTDRPLHVDHDHDTGVIRGVLCNSCNWGIAKFGDDPERLREAARYLERTSVS